MRSPNARMQRLMRIRIRDFRFANGFTQEEMAEHLRLMPEDYEALENGKAEFLIKKLYYHFIFKPRMLPEEYRLITKNEGIERAVCDYIAGMTDKYAIDLYSEIFIPKSWK